MNMKRLFAAAFLLLVVAGGIALTRIDGVRRSSAVPAGITVATLDGLTIDGHEWDSSVFDGRRWLLVYVNEQCGHCHAQLAAWQTLAAGTMHMAHPAMVVVRRRTYPSSNAPKLPDAFPHVRVLDTDGSIATALGITVVPTTIVLAGNTVESVYEGPVAPRTLLAGLASGKEPR